MNVDPVIISLEGLARLGLTDATVVATARIGGFVRFDLEKSDGVRASCAVPAVCLTLPADPPPSPCAPA